MARRHDAVILFPLVEGRVPEVMPAGAGRPGG